MLHLILLGTILQLLVVGAAVTLPIVFQPELRRALEQIGRGGLLHIGEDIADWTRPEDTSIAYACARGVSALAQQTRRD